MAHENEFTLDTKLRDIPSAFSSRKVAWERVLERLENGSDDSFKFPPTFTVRDLLKNWGKDVQLNVRFTPKSGDIFAAKFAQFVFELHQKFPGNLSAESEEYLGELRETRAGKEAEREAAAKKRERD